MPISQEQFNSTGFSQTSPTNKSSKGITLEQFQKYGFGDVQRNANDFFTSTATSIPTRSGRREARRDGNIKPIQTPQTTGFGRGVSKVLPGTAKFGQSLGQIGATRFATRKAEEVRTGSDQVLNDLITISRTGKNLQGQPISQDQLNNINNLIRERSSGLAEESNIQDIVPSAFKSNRQVLGEGAQFLGEASSLTMGGGALGTAAKGVGAGKAFLQVTKPLAIAGAKAGAVEGGLSGFGRGLEQENTIGQSIKRGVGGAAVGAGIGAAAGPLLAGAGILGRKGLQRAGVLAASEVADTVGQKALTPRNIKNAINVTRPVLSKTERSAAISSGRASIKGPLRTLRQEPTRFDREVAESVADIVKSGSGPRNQLRNVQLISNEVSNVDNLIKKEISSNNISFDPNILRESLKKAKKSSEVIFSGDLVLESRYNAVIDELIKQLNNQGEPNISNLFVARKEFDKIIRQKFPRTFDGSLSDNVTKNAILDVRRAANEFIAEQLPENNQLLNNLRREHLMLTAIDNIGDQMQGQFDKNIIDRLLSSSTAKTIGSIGVLGGLGRFIFGKRK